MIVGISVDLFTQANDFVTAVILPEFRQPPDALVWGSRVFIRGMPTRYHETFAYWVPVEIGPHGDIA